MSAQVAFAGRPDGAGRPDHSSRPDDAGRPERKYACCVLGEKDGEIDGISGTMLFYQQSGSPMKAFGVLQMDEDAVMVEDNTQREQRYMGITQGASADTCLSQGALWPFGAADIE